jgi:hypothetical protein
MNSVDTVAEFHAALTAPGRAPEIPEAADLYGWLVGDWDLDVLQFWVDVADRGLHAELHCSRILEGRALQDLWILPRRGERNGPPDPALNMYGTTLRVWDPSIQAWRITWINPVANQRVDQIGRRSGRDIVQVGALPDGTTTRWTFSEIAPDGFRWLGEALEADGRTWKRQGEFRGRRRT